MSSRKGVLPPQEAGEVSRGRINATLLLALAVMAILLWPQPADAAAWYSSLWTYRKPITIDHTKVPNTDQTSFPVLISITADSSLSAHSRSDGFDILFTSSDGVTKIPYERETYASGALVAWVKVATLSHTTDTVLYMYYGNSGATDQQDLTNVWDSNYKSVWHLDESGSGALNEYNDSTVNANDAQGKVGGAPVRVSGEIAYAQNNNAPSTKYIESGKHIGIAGNTARTITFWAKLNTTSRMGLVGWGANGTQAEFEVAVRNNHWFLWSYGLQDWDTGVTPATGSWHHHAITFDGSTARWYVDGSQLGTGFTRTCSTTDSDVFIGFESDSGTLSYLDGTIDEVRVSNVARSADWITTEYNNQRSPGSFYNVGGATAWYDAGWAYRKPITIDHTKVSNTDQSGFPVLISLSSDSDLSAHARSDGFDILFTSSDGVAKIPYEREQYASGTLVAWVKVTTLSHTTDTVLYMYYGNSSATDQQQAPSVWDSNYKAVWHMKEATGANLADSTSNNLTQTQINSPTQTATQIDGGLSFNGSTQYAVRTTNATTAIDNYTLQAWMKPGSLSQASYVVYNGNDGTGPSSGAGYGFGMGDPTNGGNPGSHLFGLYGNVAFMDSGYAFGSTSSWYHVVMKRISGTTHWYVNATATSLTSTSIPQTPNARFTIGCEADGSNNPFRYFNGTIDEVRISDIVRSVDWITTEYNNQSSAGTFHSVGGEQTFSSVGGVGEQVRPRIQIL